jgi:hypothetical protein
VKKAESTKEKEHRVAFDKFQLAMKKKSTDVTRLLNGHLLAEYYLEQIIINELARGDRLLDEGNLQFWNKLLLVKSFDILDDELITSLKNLNTVRNATSHEIDYKITETDIDKIGRSFGKQYARVKRDELSVDWLKYTLMLVLSKLSWEYLERLGDLGDET